MNQEEILKRAAEMATNPQTQAQPPQMPLGPVPMNWNIAQAQGPEGLLIVVSVQTQQGNTVFFLEPETGKKIGDALTRLSTAADSGLVLPG